MPQDNYLQILVLKMNIKNKYTTPDIEEVEMTIQNCILAGSSFNGASNDSYDYQQYDWDE